MKELITPLEKITALCTTGIQGKLWEHDEFIMATKDGIMHSSGKRTGWKIKNILSNKYIWYAYEYNKTRYNNALEIIAEYEENTDPKKEFSNSITSLKLYIEDKIKESE